MPVIFDYYETLVALPDEARGPDAVIRALTELSAHAADAS